MKVQTSICFQGSASCPRALVEAGRTAAPTKSLHYGIGHAFGVGINAFYTETPLHRDTD